MDTEYINTIIKNINKFIRSILKLSLLHKIFIILLVLLFICIFNSNYNYQYIENFINEEKFVQKYDNDVYDKQYSQHYDRIFFNKKRNNFEFENIKPYIKDNNAKILDIGSGTGYTGYLFNKNNIDCVGLDKSRDMIHEAKKNYPNSKYEIGDILDTKKFDFNEFSHITCLGKTIYEIKDKKLFFENCKPLLHENGYLIIHLLDRDNFKPYVQEVNKKVLYNPEKYNKNIDQLIVKFDKDNEYISNFKKNDKSKNNSTNKLSKDATPYITYYEKFENFSNNNVRKNEINLYIPEISKILELAKVKGFKLIDKIEMESVGYLNEFLYIFKKQ
tara:strand:- start:94 stop:1086 length:993 start_codon:yes stop_codon:yes gene_type:complete